MLKQLRLINFYTPRRFPTLTPQSRPQVVEQSGEVGEMLEQIAAFHDEELARWIDWFSRLFEPILMAAIGLVIGAIVILMYMPIFELAGNLQ